MSKKKSVLRLAGACLIVVYACLKIIPGVIYGNSTTGYWKKRAHRRNRDWRPARPIFRNNFDYLDHVYSILSRGCVEATGKLFRGGERRRQHPRYIIQGNSNTPAALGGKKTIFLRMFSSEAAQKIPDDEVDFIYVDARHDYCGVKEDLELYWPKLKQGGIMAGHDYMTAEDVAVHMPEEDWGICADGSRNNGYTRSAETCQQDDGLYREFDQQPCFLRLDAEWELEGPCLREYYLQLADSGLGAFEAYKI